MSSIQDLINDFVTPIPIDYWEKSFGLNTAENKEKHDNGFAVRQHAINYVLDEESESMAKFTIKTLFIKNELLYFTSLSYGIDNPNLKGSIDYNVDYRIYYYKLICIIDALNKSMEVSIKQGIISQNDFLELIQIDKLYEFPKQPFTTIETKRIHE